jgi:hypothetical protein
VRTLRLVLQNFRYAYILVDALDECTDRETLLELIVEIVNWKLPTLGILITSRREQDLVDGLIPCGPRQIDLQDKVTEKDIRTYIQAMIRQDPKLQKWSADVKAEIEVKLVKGAQGM